MNLKVLFLLLFYYAIMSSFFLLSDVFEDSGASSNINLASSELQEEEIDTGGLFGTGVSFGRFFGLVSFGIGLPDETPNWFKVLFTLWQSCVSIFVIAFIISSIWDG